MSVPEPQAVLSHPDDRDVLGFVDGNAIAGLLFEAFGAEMTTAVGVCRRCGARAPAAELRVYVRGPGAVGRCRNCSAILIVISQIRGVACVDLDGFASLESAA